MKLCNSRLKYKAFYNCHHWVWLFIQDAKLAIILCDICVQYQKVQMYVKEYVNFDALKAQRVVAVNKPHRKVISGLFTTAMTNKRTLIDPEHREFYYILRIVVVVIVNYWRSNGKALKWENSMVWRWRCECVSGWCRSDVRVVSDACNIWTRVELDS